MPSCFLGQAQGHKVVIVIFEAEFEIELQGGGVAPDDFEVDGANALTLGFFLNELHGPFFPAATAIGLD